jgi:hypothetical protein
MLLTWFTIDRWFSKPLARICSRRCANKPQRERLRLQMQS